MQNWEQPNLRVNAKMLEDSSAGANCVWSNHDGYTFTIGQGYQPAVTEGTKVVPVGPLLVGTHNEFFDQYSVTSNFSWLDYYGAGNSCAQTCSQQYNCGQGQILNHTFIYSFTKSHISGTKVTLVTVAE